MQASSMVAVAGIAGSVFGSLGGIFIGQLMSRSSQRQQWFLDTRKQEYQELLSAFSTAYMALQHLYEPGSMSCEEDERYCKTVEQDSYTVLRSRIYVARELESENIRYRWAEALVNFRDTKDARKFADRFNSICDTIVWLATGDGERPAPG